MTHQIVRGLTPTVVRRLAHAAVFCLLSWLTIGGPAQAAEPRFDLRYNVLSTGMEVGQVVLRAWHEADELATSFAFRSKGVLSLLRNSYSDLEARTRYDDVLLPVSFASVAVRGERRREARISYNADGKLAALTFRRNSRPRPGEPPQAMTDGTVDPLTAFLRARAWLANVPVESRGASATFPVFDGRRRFDIRVEHQGRTRVELDGTSRPAIRLLVSFITRAELDDETGAVEQEPERPERLIDLTVSDDGRYVPLTLRSQGGRLPLRIELAADCAVASAARVCAAFD